MSRLARRSPLLLAALLAFGASAAERRVPRAKPAAGASALESVSPAAVGLSAERLALLDRVVDDAIARKELPGAVVLVGRHGKIAYEKAYGFRALEPEKEPMTKDTVFDLASLTKTVATATSVMTLVESGKLRITDAVVKHLPEFAAGGGLREKVTIEQLLTHRSGLPPDDPMDLYTGAPAAIFGKSFRLPLATAPGEKFVYSDVGYEVLAEVVRAVSGEPLDRYAKERVFAPLGMAETEFRPIGSGGALPVARIAPTERKDGRFLRGEVHDPHAYALGGVAGHAGLFSTARDLARFCRMVLDGGPVLSPAARAAMTRTRAYGDADLRALGWDVATAYSSSRGDLFPLGSFGHTGWTGTSFWLDPTTDTFVILLSNRNHPDGSGNVIALRSKVATIAASAVADVDAEKLRAASLPV
ncbi:MAG TPA: serine hydrolase domain-containing protein, partial [Thermoanaerobaculia bacterium]|nr:serine hydrolase domain-containing protein [Thermoanaerobaculia bacterium]